jgi:uncharacterized protein YbjT (DUF2867 family)
VIPGRLDPTRAAGLPERAERVVGDLGEPATLTPAFAGVDKLFLLTQGIGTDHTDHAIAAAQAAGLNHIVHLSSLNVLGDPMPAMGRWHHEREEIIRASGIPVTFLQPGGFTTNALEWVPTMAVASGFPRHVSGSGSGSPTCAATAFQRLDGGSSLASRRSRPLRAARPGRPGRR